MNKYYQRINATIGRGDGTMTPAQEDRVAVYRKIGYSPLAMAGNDLVLTRWVLKDGRQGLCTLLIDPSGKTVKTLVRYDYLRRSDVVVETQPGECTPRLLNPSFDGADNVTVYP